MLAACLGTSKAAGPTPLGDGTRILFVGNSLTYVNDVPGILQALADSAGGEQLAVASWALPNYALIDHWTEGLVQREIARGGWAWVVIIGNGLAGLWALGAHKLPSLRTRALWWFTGLVEITIFVQVALGVGLQTGEDIEPPAFHSFYGFVALFAVAILYAYRLQLRHRLYLLYGFGSLFVMGLSIRALLVGGAR